MVRIYFRILTILGLATGVALPALAQTIVVDNLGSPLCAGRTLLVNFTVSGGSFGTGNTFFVQLSDATGNFPASPTEIGNVIAVGSSQAFATIPASTPAGTGYRIRIEANNPVVLSNVSDPFEITSSLPDPSTFGDGVWHGYVFRDLNFSDYAGYFIEPGLSFDRFFGNFVSPSSEPGFLGCFPPVAFTNYTVSYRRTNFVCNYYQIDLVYNDEECELYIDGTLVFSRFECCPPRPNIWRGFLGPNSRVEFRWRQRVGESRGAINVNPVPFGNLVAPSVLQVCAGGSAPIAVSAPLPLQYTWAPATGLSATTGATVVASPASTTTYTVTATDPTTGCVATTANVQVLVGGPPQALSVAPANPITCPGAPVTLTANGGSGYTWSPATGLNTTTGATVVASPLVTTTYTVTANDGCNPARSATVTVNVGPPTQPAAFGTGQWNVFAYSDVFWTSFAGYYTEPSLSFDSRNRWDVFQSPDQASGYVGCSVPTEFHSVSYRRTGFVPCNVVYQLDIADVQNDVQVWLNGTQRFAGSNGSFPNAWRGILGFSSELEVRWRSFFNQSYAAISLRPISPVPAATVRICPGESYELSAVDIPGAFYEWRLGVGGPAIASTRTVTISPASTQVYEVFIFSPEANCPASATVNVIVDPSTSPVPVFPTNVLELAICPGQSVVLTAGGTGSPSDFTWSPAAGLNTTVGQSVIATPSQTTVYTVTQNLSASCSGPSRTGTVTVVVGQGNVDDWGNNEWLAQAFAQGQYAGFYRNPNLNVDSRTLWDPNSSPSNATGYVGCPVPSDFHRVRYRRRGFPCGYYRISIPTYAPRTQSVSLSINGAAPLTFTFPASPPHNNLWEGFLHANSTIEFSWDAEIFESFAALNLANVGNEINFVANEVTICNNPQGVANPLVANWPTIPGATFAWSVANPGLLSLSSNTGSSITASALVATNTTTTITAVLTDPVSGCTLTRTFPARITTAPNYALVPGNTPLCQGDSVTVTVTGGSRYTWTSVPPGNPGLQFLSGAGDVVKLGPSTTATYTATAINGCETVALPITVNVQIPIAPADIWGNGKWVAMHYDGVETFIDDNRYRGFFEVGNGNRLDSLTFSTSDLYPPTAQPSVRPGYQGCDVANDNHTSVYRRTNFECGVYSFGVASVIGEWELSIDGFQIASSGSGTFPNIWTGVLTNASRVQFRYRSRVGDSFFSVLLSTSQLGQPGTASVWTGAVNSDWYNALNWCAEVPTSTVSAIIAQNGARPQPVIDPANNGGVPSAAANRLELRAGAQLTLVGSTSLAVHSDWRNDGGQLASSPAAEVVLTGSASSELGGNTPTFFGNLRLQKTTPGQTVTLTNRQVAQGTLTLENTGLVLNSHRMTIDNPSPAALVRVGEGYVRSETNAADNPSYLCWNLGIQTGVYTFPFGLTNAPADYLPVTLEKLDNAFGDFCLSTRRTGADNLPYASNVTVFDVPASVVVDRWWHLLINDGLTDALPNQGYNLALRYPASENTLPPALNTQPLKAQKANGLGIWTNPPDQDFTAGATTGTGTNTVRGLREGGALVLLTEDFFLLPVQLVGFQGRFNLGHVLLEWQTASETNNDYFEVERSADGQRFVAVGRVPGRGNGLRQTTHYQLVDREPLPGLAYYRLRQVDQDGTVAYSRIIAVTSPGLRGPYLVAQPNPTSADQLHVFVQTEGAVRCKLRLVDLTGRVLAEELAQANAQGQLFHHLRPAAALASGVYYCQAIYPGQVLQTKVMVH